MKNLKEKIKRILFRFREEGIPLEGFISDNKTYCKLCSQCSSECGNPHFGDEAFTECKYFEKGIDIPDL